LNGTCQLLVCDDIHLVDENKHTGKNREYLLKDSKEVSLKIGKVTKLQALCDPEGG
jgi:hypothetical protein